MTYKPGPALRALATPHPGAKLLGRLALFRQALLDINGQVRYATDTALKRSYRMLQDIADEALKEP